MKALILVAAALTAPAADFSYYMLALSYAPEFCSHAANKDSRECAPGKGFVVHGLWPQLENGRSPEGCGPARPVAASLVRTMLSYIPTESLIQHEWAAHGTCSGLGPEEYFTLVRSASESLRIPQKFENLRQTFEASPLEIENQFAAANPGVPRNGFRTSCYADGGLQEIRVCFDKNLTPRPCTGPAECTRAKVRMAPMDTRRY